MEDEDHWPLTDTRLRRRKPPPCCIVATLLGILLVVALIAVVGLSIGVKLEHDKQAGSPCATPQCVELSYQILSKLDESFHPCDDFYNFACNRFLNESIIPYGRAAVGSLDAPGDLLKERFRTLMESGDTRGSKAVAKAITYYQSCMNTYELEDSALSALIGKLKELGGWPLVGIPAATNASWDINDQNGFLQEILYGSNAFFTVSVRPHPFNSSRNILTVDQGGLTMPKAFLNESLLEALKDQMLTVFKAINSSVSEDVYNASIAEILEFEEDIANFTTDSPEMINVTSIDTLNELMPIFNWTAALKYYGKIGNFSINETAPVNILAPQFLSSMNNLIEQFMQNEAIILENYAKWHLVYSLLPTLNKELSDVHYKFFNKLKTGGDDEPPRYETCVGKIEMQIPFALARTFTDKYFPPGSEIIGNISEVVMGLRTALQQRIHTRDWLDETTELNAIEKADKIVAFLAYPQKILNDTFLDDFYGLLDISSSYNFFLNYLNATKFQTLQVMAGLGTLNNRSAWNMNPMLLPPTILNAFYNPYGNNIYILEGILNAPFFKTYWPDYFKFGTIGFVIGHELLHGFDNQGRLFDDVGNRRNWWTLTSEKNFISRADCFVQQYNKYSLDAGNVNGTRTLGENIADNGGLAIAYQAYMNKIEQMGQKEQTLPGLSSYTPEQIFFIGTAQPWCQRIATLEKEKTLLEDVHTPSPLRARGFLSNSHEFAKAFECSQSERMNPPNKCELW